MVTSDWRNLNCTTSLQYYRDVNEIPESILQIESLKEFKGELFKLLVRRAYYSIKDYLNDKFD